MAQDLTRGSMTRILARFSLPYLLSCFLQTFYGLADLFIAGRFCGTEVITAVSVGSQVMHMATVVIAGMAMGSTICASRATGARDGAALSRTGASSLIFFAASSLAAAPLLILCGGAIIRLLSVPAEAAAQTGRYLSICFAGIPAIAAYNCLGGIFRGTGDTKTPLAVVALAGVLNVILDIIFIGTLRMEAAGAALATAIAQYASLALIALAARKAKGLRFSRRDFRADSQTLSLIIRIGAPIALQDGLIQVSFLAITVIANSRGVSVAAAVGIVEKVIGFLFLVPSAMLSSVAVAAAQNAGAKLHGRATQALFCGTAICVAFGLATFAFCQIFSPQIVALFARDAADVIAFGAQYLRPYALDCALAGVHFCFSGYFSAYGKSGYSFLHNIISVVAVRVPGAYLASELYPQTLLPMGMAAPAGSLLSVVICAFLYGRLRRREGLGTGE